MTHELYIPGTCNIGPAEIRRRYYVGIAGSALALMVFVCLEWFDLSKSWRLLVFPPVFAALSGFIQAHQRFCYRYGWKGVFSFSGQRQFESIADAAMRRRDRKMALKLIGIITFGSTVLTLAYYLA